MSEEIKTVETPAEIEMICLPAKPLKPRPKEHTAQAKLIAKRYLSVAALEKIINSKKQIKQKKAAERFKMPTTQEEFYDRGQKYVNGALCAVPFQEKASYYKRAAEMFAGAEDYQDAPELAKECDQRSETILKEGYEGAYAEAVELKNKAVTADDWFIAARAFERIPEYRDADEQADFCERKLSRLNAFKGPKIVIILLLVVGLIFGAVQYTKTNSFKLNAAKAAYSMGLDNMASTFLKALDGYEDTKNVLADIRYEHGVKHMKAGRYSSAAKAFKACGEYLDSPQLMQECSYYAGVDKLKAGNYEDAQKLLYAAAGYEDADAYLVEADRQVLENAKLGKHIQFGRRDCILLDNTDGVYFLLSSKLYGKEAQYAYNDTRTAVTWQDCSLRSIFNGIYMEDSFSQAEQAVMVETETMPGVTDRVFLLSQEEYLRYQSVMGEKKALWWLRDQGDHEDTAMFVSYDGEVMASGYSVDDHVILGRPAFKVQFH